MEPNLKERSTRRAIAFGGGAIGFLAVVAAHQLGIVRRLPDPPGTVWASNRITSSRAAHPFGIPDGLLGIGSYSVTLALLAASRCSPGARALLPWKLAADTGAAVFSTVRQIAQFRGICSWCTGAALATAGMVYFGLRSLRTDTLPSTR